MCTLQQTGTCLTGSGLCLDSDNYAPFIHNMWQYSQCHNPFLTIVKQFLAYTDTCKQLNGQAERPKQEEEVGGEEEEQ